MGQAENTEDFLEHYGIKGMRWGKTTKSGSSGLNPMLSVENKKYSKADILDARQVMSARGKAIRDAAANAPNEPSRPGKKVLTKEAADASRAYTKDATNYIANRKTTGEKVRGLGRPGVRDSGAAERASSSSPYEKSNTSRNIKIAGTAAVGIGALAVGAYLVKSGAINANTLSSASNAVSGFGSNFKMATQQTRVAAQQTQAKVQQGKQFTQDFQASRSVWNSAVADLRNDIATENARLDRKYAAEQANFDKNYPIVK